MLKVLVAAYLLCAISVFTVAIDAGWVTYDQLSGKPYQVGYDSRAFTINGKRTILLAAVIHYPRSTPIQWRDLFKKAKENGMNLIQTYVFWNAHEKVRGQEYDFSFNNDVFKFLDIAREEGLFVNLRLGPYVCAEWTYGGLPLWLQQIEGLKLRTTNAPWQKEMARFTTDISRLIEPYLARNGGPIIMSQIENEINWSDEYVDWCGAFSANLKLDIPFLMCGGKSANGTVNAANSCNGVDEGYTSRHVRDHPNQPLAMTENEAWFQRWGKYQGYRSTENLAYSVAGWIAAGGSYHAYYMWHGGNNYGITASASTTTNYANDANLYSDGTRNEPKYSHCGFMHKIAIKYSSVLLGQDIAVAKRLPWWDPSTSSWRNGTSQQVYEYGSGDNKVTFLYSSATSTVALLYNNKNITMSKKSIKVLVGRDDQLVYDTSIVKEYPKMVEKDVVNKLEWSAWSEPLGSLQQVVASRTIPFLVSGKLLEQLNVTGEDTHRMWYRAQVSVPSAEVSKLSFNGMAANAYLVFIDGEYIGQVYDIEVRGTRNYKLEFKTNKNSYILEILSVSYGQHNEVYPDTRETKGVIGDLIINGKDVGKSVTTWVHQKKLAGEYLKIYQESNRDLVHWDNQLEKFKNKALTWYTAKFNVPQKVSAQAVTNPVLVKVDAGTLNRGHIYVNGFDLGMYYTILGKCVGTYPCSVIDKSMCDQPSQTSYHIPPEFVKENGNIISIIEEQGGLIDNVKIVRKE
ncbi:beta-galactosidase [Acrasis kona]|uniref:beta-galactosidase n=1 Tax=Acrasis kona TaxID=1008807 RepID=A0AAW2Z9X0_9EUKA